MPGKLSSRTKDKSPRKKRLSIRSHRKKSKYKYRKVGPKSRKKTRKSKS